MGDRNAITVFKTVDGQPCNKLVARAPDGSVTKGMVEHRQHYIAEHRLVPDLASLAALLREVGRCPDQALSLSLFVDPPAPRWQTWSASRMARFLGCGKEERTKLAGWHDVGSGMPTCVRMKENMELSALLMFDRDAADGMPPELADLDFDDWCAAVDLLWPGFAACGKVWQPSTSTRVLIDGQALESRSWHAFVFVDDPDAVPAAWAYAFERCAVTQFAARPWDEPVLLGFAKPRHARASGEIIGHQLWTIYDRSTWAVNRLVFDGMPTVAGRGLTVAPPSVAAIDGPGLVPSHVKVPSARELKAIREATKSITGHDHRPDRTYGVTRRGQTVVTGTMYVIPDLLLPQAVEAWDGPVTVEDFMRSGLEHLRIQSPYRESASWAAFLGVHRDGTPFLYDSGTDEKHVLDRERLERRMWAVILDWLQEDYQPAFGYPDGGVFSRHLGRKMLMRDVHENPEIIDRLAMASDAPCTKEGKLNRLALPIEFRKWLKISWGALLRVMPSESLVLDEEASDTLPLHVMALLKAMVACEDPTPWGSARRAIGTWCHWYASQKPGYWSRVGSYDVWGRIKDGVFQIALTQALAGQVNRGQYADIAAMTPAKFTKRCNRYGITEPESHVWDGEKQTRAVVLAGTFVVAIGLSTEHRDMRAEAIHNVLHPEGAPNGETGLPPTGGGQTPGGSKVH